MAQERSVFPLRFRRPRLRGLVKQLAARESISQNELIEQAVEHEVIARGALIADDLACAAEALNAAVLDQYAALVSRSIDSFAESELRTDPLRSVPVQPRQEVATEDVPDAVALFRQAIDS